MSSGVLDLSEYIRVTNNTGKDIRGRYDGKDYLFKNGEPTDVFHLAARHIFDFGKTDKSQCFHRLGWLDGKTYEEAEALLQGIVFDEVPSPALDISPGKKRRSKISTPTPLANADADEGEDETSPTEATGTLGDL
jgi:hypothetical protein